MDSQSQSLACIFETVLYCPRCVKWASRKHRAALDAGLEPKPDYLSADEWQGIRAKDRTERLLEPRPPRRKRGRRRRCGNIATIRRRLIHQQPACAGCQRILVLEPVDDPAAACLVGSTTLYCPACAGAIMAETAAKLGRRDRRGGAA
jgi:hypothetical protein